MTVRICHPAIMQADSYSIWQRRDEGKRIQTKNMVTNKNIPHTLTWRNARNKLISYLCSNRTQTGWKTCSLCSSALCHYSFSRMIWWLLIKQASRSGQRMSILCVKTWRDFYASLTTNFGVRYVGFCEHPKFKFSLLCLHTVSYHSLTFPRWLRCKPHICYFYSTVAVLWHA